MDLRRRQWFLLAILLSAALLIELQLSTAATAPENLVFQVRSKFAGKREKDLGALRAHDVHRHSRLLSAIDLPLGGDSQPESIGLYFAKIGLGTPSRDFHVQVDTGSDILWVNCAGCIRCPRKSDLVELTPYDADASSTAKSVSCSDNFCSYVNQRSECHSGSTCQYVILYGDGSSTNGYLVRDVVHLDLVTGNRQTGSTNGTIIFGCGSKQSGQLGESQAAVDGIMGFGQSNSSFISQLASQGKVKRSFAHCLDNNNGGGIFVIGEVVSPKVKTTPMLSKSAHYSVNLNAIEVGNSVLKLSSDAFDSGDDKGVIIDSGTTLVYLPDAVYNPLMNQILASHQELNLHTVQDSFTCFHYIDKLDRFPTVTFQFDKSVSLAVYPREYLFQVREDTWCFGWQNGGLQTKGGASLTILGDMALSNKLVVYDIENQVIGWTNHNCSGGIQVKDEETGAIYTVGAHNLSWSSSLAITKLLTLVSFLIPFFCNIAL
ncbi:Xylanase inhibitor C-terminal [Arabidopsis thaliana x Arabidopsis arenosa]|uniref:Xylanase inhibitor C-terminal n=1 Tax=Arabidopsis thaliana x Arabidopsis arenosa TaxID=1240361 RepID=A0A8T2ANM7_9BRAS|nr:Xylanase inhibitor C-terminal [Arabidopsis thaliana x Arabidopsis arenosa]